MLGVSCLWNHLFHYISLDAPQVCAKWSDFLPDGGHLLAVFSFICCCASYESFEVKSNQVKGGSGVCICCFMSHNLCIAETSRKIILTYLVGFYWIQASRVCWIRSVNQLHVLLELITWYVVKLELINQYLINEKSHPTKIL